MSHDHPLSILVAAAPALFLPLIVRLGNEPKPETRVGEPEPSRAFAAPLEAQLLGLSVRGYERLIAHLLRAAGYDDVRILRDHRVPRRSHKGRNTHGGVDLTALIRTEFNAQQVLVQVKQYRRPISRRFVDELRGALLRTQARQGLLITTSTFAPGARRAAQEDHIGPIHLIDGPALQDLLVQYRLGVRQNHKGRLALRRRFFARLEKPVMQSQEIGSTVPDVHQAAEAVGVLTKGAA